jgi:glycosyltransferase involved in cell wall biosynthesis
MQTQSKTIVVLGLTHPFRGGIAHYSTILVRALRQRGFNVAFLTLKRQYPAWLFPGRDQYDHSDMSICETNTPMIDSMNPLTWIKTAWRIRKMMPALVVIQWWNPFFGFAFGTIANLLAKTSNIRVCFICHNVVPHEHTIFDKMLLKYAFQSVNHYIVHSETDKNNLFDLIKNKKAVIKHNSHSTYKIFSDFGMYDKADAKRRLGISIQKKTVLFFGFVRKYKGLKYLIRAMSEVVQSVDCILLIAGEFYDDKEDYLLLISELGLEDHTIVMDTYIRNEDVALYFCSADVVVLPYIEATQSGIVQIAFGLQTPVITTSVGGLPEVVAHGKTGLLVDKPTPEEIARAIIHYYAEDYEAVFRAEIARTSSQFQWDSEIHNLELFMTETNVSAVH